MRIVVTGGAGFIGSHVVERLRGQHEVLVVDSKKPEKANVPPYLAGLDVVEADICSDKAAAAIGRFRPDAVVHLAAQVSVTASMSNPMEDTRVNVLGLTNVFMAAKPSAKTFVFASSGGAIYGNPAVLPATEQTPIVPESVYGANKAHGEALIGHMSRASEVRCVSLRFANVYGPRQASHGEGGVVAIFTDKMMANITPTIFGDGQQTRDFVFVKDVAAAVDKALTGSAAGGFNIASNEEISLLDLTGLLKHATGYTGEVLHAPARRGEVNRSLLSFDKAAAELDWRPETSLFAGLLDTVDYLRSSKGEAEAVAIPRAA